ncbi:ABC transporter permease [Gryllotalpicola protaetiae]|uniref:ABC transporter permease n=1 Tax=Gryllotalpicola protaetiae TaxID=2419771 RepID=A0A387BET3_9MICO|nr:ABC transporter permease [Gryllotalpicola protaetiae]AYG02413.1 ABC transporter permease [Gryllotalpicola protaetiae]
MTAANRLADARPLNPRARRRPLLPIIYWLVVAITLVPIAVMVVYSFNVAPNHRITYVWHGFTLNYYVHLADLSGLWQAFVLSIVIAVVSGLISVLIGTPLALALERHRFWGRRLLTGILFVDIAAPSIVVGAAALSFFLSIGVHTGVVTILLVHVTFNIAYVVVTLRARLSGVGTALEQAAADLGAAPVNAFFRVTLPIMMPGIVAAFMLALAMSIDDYVITSFVAGSATTFPLFVYGVKTGLPPQVLCMGTIIFAVGLLLALLNGALNRRGRA